MGGAAHNQLELRDQQSDKTAYERRVDSLVVVVRKTRRELAEVRAYLKPGIKRLGSTGGREAEPANRGGLLASLRKLWPFGNG